ncbi:class I SAM-dependent methyltransferase [Devosia alba]|uniref:class I SAM-dependent methyltransferase n=1 Tax=Devosia alba TaxID=3152360 RepID=UPI00326696B6
MSQQTPDSGALKLLEVGASNGVRLGRVQRELGMDVAGVEPSAAAVAEARTAGLNLSVGTAEHLPFPDTTFDVIVFGFCLYLCDPADLFRIAAEADRVLKKTGWIIIQDFYATAPATRPYHHLDGVYSRKMDYRTLFSWHPAYTCYSQRITAHQTRHFADDPQEWVATSVLRKL